MTDTECADPPIPFPAIWAASILGTPVTGLALYLVWRKGRPRAASHAARAAFIGLIAWLLVLDELGAFTRHPIAPKRAAPTATSTPAPSAGSTTASSPSPKTAADQATFTQIMIAYTRPGGVTRTTRTKDEAYMLARALIAQIRGGSAMEPLVSQYTDDRGDDGKPYNSGSYTLARKSPAVEAIRKAVFGLGAGEVTAEPVDSGYAFHVIRREN